MGRPQRHRTLALRRSSGAPLASDELLQVGDEGRPQLVPLESVCEVGLEIAQAISGIVPLSLEAVSEEALALCQRGQRIGQLDLTADARTRVPQDLEDRRREDVAP